MKDEYTKDFERRFPNPEEVIRHIDYLKSLDLTKISDSELDKSINDRFKFIPITSVMIPAGSEIFRARVNPPKTNAFNKLQDIYAPPSEFITKYGRLNKPGERIFYGAVNFKLAAFEVVQELRKSFNPSREHAFLVIGIWKTKVDLHVASIHNDQNIHDIRTDIKGRYESDQKMFKEGVLEESVLSANDMMLQFFSEEFTKSEIRSEFDYRITNFYMSTLKKMNSRLPPFAEERFDGVNYPSVAMKYKGDNIALFIDSADSKLEFVNALQVICANPDFENGDFTAGILHEMESFQNEEINWSKELYR